jgi:hypothetical protein
MVALLIYAMIDEARNNPDQGIVKIQLGIMLALLVSGPLIYGALRLVKKSRPEAR